MTWRLEMLTPIACSSVTRRSTVTCPGNPQTSLGGGDFLARDRSEMERQGGYLRTWRVWLARSRGLLGLDTQFSKLNQIVAPHPPTNPCHVAE